MQQGTEAVSCIGKNAFERHQIAVEEAKGQITVGVFISDFLFHFTRGLCNFVICSRFFKSLFIHLYLHVSYNHGVQNSIIYYNTYKCLAFG